MFVESNNNNSNEVLVSMLMLLTHLYSSEQLLSISQQLQQQDEEQTTIVQTQQLETQINQTTKDLSEESSKSDLLQELDISFNEENLFFKESPSFVEPFQETRSENTTNNNLSGDSYNSLQHLPHLPLSQCCCINCCNYTNSLTLTVCCQQPQFINTGEFLFNNNNNENQQVVVNNNNNTNYYYNKRKRESISSISTSSTTEKFMESPLKTQSQPKKSKRGIISLPPHEFVFMSENNKNNNNNNNNAQQLFILHTPQEMQQQLEAMKIKKRRGRPRKYLNAKKHNK